MLRITRNDYIWNAYLFPAFFQAYRWCIEAMKEITPGLPVKVVVDVLRQASKVTNVLLNHNILFTYYWLSLHKLSIAQQSVLPGKEITYRIVWNLTFCLGAAGLCGEERVQKSRAADQTRSVSSKVTCCILKITSKKHFFCYHAFWFHVMCLTENILDTSIPSTLTRC